MLDAFFRHYESWIDHFFILDDFSTDGTREYLESRSDVNVGDVPRSNPDSWVLSAKAIYDAAWQQSSGTADWVVVTNIDEHLHHPTMSMSQYLAHAFERGVTCVPALGYQMLADRTPAPTSLLSRDEPFGAPWYQMSKLGIFRPDVITETNFSPGRHRADFVGHVVFPERDDVLNLHYKYLDIDHVQQRHNALAARLLPIDRERGFGHRYHWDIDELRADFASFRERQVDIGLVDHHTEHQEPRWWRPE